MATGVCLFKCSLVVFFFGVVYIFFIVLLYIWIFFSSNQTRVTYTQFACEIPFLAVRFVSERKTFERCLGGLNIDCMAQNEETIQMTCHFQCTSIEPKKTNVVKPKKTVSNVLCYPISFVSTYNEQRGESKRNNSSKSVLGSFKFDSSGVNILLSFCAQKLVFPRSKPE